MNLIKKLNCDRKVAVVKPEKYNKALKLFNKKTCYLEFEPTFGIGKHCQIAFNLCSSQYNEKTNTITLEVVVDKFYIDGVLKPIQDINGIYCQCNIDHLVYSHGQCSWIQHHLLGCTTTFNGRCVCNL